MKVSKITLKKNRLGRDFVTGDIHGETNSLLEGLKSQNFDFDLDRLICCGDLIDRGPNSPEALSLLQAPWFFSVMGNHEYLMLNALKYSNNQDQLAWLSNGGNWISETSPELWNEWLNQIENLPLGIELVGKSGKKYGITHADFPKESWEEFEKMTEKDVQATLWSRSAFMSRDPKVIKGIDTLFHGHSVVKGGLKLGNRHYIENGAYKGNGFLIIEIL